MTDRYEFQAPSNLDAIRSSIMERIKQRNVQSNPSSVASSPLTPPHLYDEKMPMFVSLDNGLPSPPIEFYEEPKMLPTETVLMEQVESSEQIRERIRLLKEEKHKLFQVMKDLLSKPTEKPRARSTSREAVRPVVRSRSISEHHHNRPRYYSNNNRYYAQQSHYSSSNNRRSMTTSLSNSSSPYVSRPPLAVRSSSGSFRRPNY